ncbi:hypothetical protein LA374_16585 [Aeromonas schubertii]|uniref:SWIM-type domain-containing protein n=1 Tax=Aeromonas schubertii TaxID=652 RepID=A0ABS7VEM6_9GAMM|nr:SWIM zinc finger family protein [Aeromonas schubertii]MBZ6067811.1 hypothetical protein [Aeromonas schubertii]
MASHSPQDPAPIDIDELKAQSGEASFAKGLTLAVQGAVQQLGQDGNTLSARVQGSHLYRVRLEMGRTLVSHCNCPAADYQTLCKHGVATALAFNRRLSGLGDKQGTISNIPDERSRLRGYFERHGKPALLELLLDELGRDPKRWRHWLGRVDLDTQAPTPAKLKSLINKALPKRNVWEWQKVRDYFREAEALFEAIWESTDALPLEPRWALTWYALERLNLVLQQVDDSNGERVELEEAMCARLPALFARLSWSESDKVDWLFTHLLEQPSDIFPDEEAFGDLVHSALFLARCEEKLASLLAAREPGYGYEWTLQRYAHPLLEAARAVGDWRRELTVLASIASTTRDWLELCALCCDHGEPLEGEFWLAKARKQAQPPYETDACDEADIALSIALGDKARAWRLARGRFERRPHVEGFEQLRQLQQQLEWHDETLLPWVEQHLKERAAVKQVVYSPQPHDALVHFYLDQERLHDACDWVATHKISPRLLLTLADKIAPTDPLLAIGYCFRVAASYVASGHNEGYEQAVAALRQCEQSLGDDKAQQEHFNQQLDALVAEHKRKRNFITLVNHHFASRL